MWNVKDFGAAGDGKTRDSSAIQAAIDKCAQSGGGTVICGAGTYLVACLELKSGVNLHLTSGAVLKALPGREDYPADMPKGIVLRADGAENFSLSGEGTVLGPGQEPWGRAEWPRPPLDFRVKLLLFENCKNVSICGLTFRMSDCWALHFRLCENVHIEHCKIFNNYFRANSDGIDPDSCKNFFISNCHIIAGDDCIVAKTTQNHPMENLVVTNCILESISTALKLGTESLADFRDILFSNCIIRNSFIGLGIYVKDGAVVERVKFNNITIENPVADHKTINPVFIDIEKRHSDSKIGRVRDLVFSNITINSSYSSLIQGMPESPIENLTLSNINIRVPRAIDFSGRSKNVGGDRTTEDDGRDTTFITKPAYMAIAHAKGLTIDNFRVTIEENGSYNRAALYVYDAEDVNLKNVKRLPKNVPPVILENCRDIVYETNE